MPDQGFLKLRRGLIEHAAQGKLPPVRFALLIQLLMQADPSTGFAWSSAKALSAVFGYGERAAREALEDLESSGYVKRFTTPGKHGNYPIALDKYETTAGARKKSYLNARATIDWKNPIYETREESVEESSPYKGREREREREQKQNNHVEANAPTNLSVELANGTHERQVVQRVWTHYLDKLGKNGTLLTFSPGRRQKGLARFREALQKAGGDIGKAEALMRLAVDALASSDFHNGSNGRGKQYDSWEKNLFQSLEKFEWWLERT